MAERQEIARFRKLLLDRRAEILELRIAANETWQTLHQREIEYEEQAENEYLSRDLEQLDEQEKDEIEAIDTALHKIELNNYGTCESCGRNIGTKRLEAIPWTPWCKQCAAGMEGRKTAAGRGEEAAAPLPADLDGYSDEEICAAVEDDLRSDGRVQMDELTIDCRDGVLYLGGHLVGELEHQILLEIVQDIVGLPNVVDQVRKERQPWQQKDAEIRDQGERIEPVDEEYPPQPDAGEAAFEAMQEGFPITPPDEIIPEKEE